MPLRTADATRQQEFPSAADIMSPTGQLCCLCNSSVDHISAVQERVHCYKCLVSTHEHDYTQYFFDVMAKGIGDQEVRLPGQPLGHTLTELESHSLKSCDDEKGIVRLSPVHCCCCFATSGWQVCIHVTFPAAGASTACWHQPSRTIIQEPSKNSVVIGDVSLLLAQLVQQSEVCMQAGVG